jgi:DNA polymerase-1
VNPWGWDTESHLISPGCLAPRMVCASYAWRMSDGGMDSSLHLREPGLDVLEGLLRDPEILLVAHNETYDLGCAAAENPALLPLIFDAYRAGRVECTMIKQQVIDVALGMRKFRRVNGVVSRASYGLDDLVQLYYDRRLEKADTWRLRYAMLDGVPIEQWPPEAREYAIGDAVEALQVWEAQEREIAELWPGGLPNQAEQQMASWALHLMSLWCIRAEEAAVNHFVSRCEEEISKMHLALEGTGIFNEKTGSRVMAEIRRRVVESLERLQVAVPRTEPSSKAADGQVKTDKDTLLLTDDTQLHVLAEALTFEKHLGQWGPVLRAATQRAVSCRYTTLMETGRVSSSGSEGQEGTNITNPPRKGDVRPCIVPRPGYGFVATDADTVELRAHAQNQIDMGIRDVRLAQTFIEQKRDGGPDAHEVMAAGIMRMDPREVQRLVREGDKAADDARQFAKIPGYAFPGGGGARMLPPFAAAQLSRRDYERWFTSDREEAEIRAQGFQDTWFDMFPENREYQRIIKKMIDWDSRSVVIQQLMSGRIRRIDNRPFTTACNGLFQGRVADAMKEVLFWLSYECYTGRCFEQHRHGGDFCTHEGRSVIYGSRVSMFLHDEPILEHPIPTIDVRAARQQYVMVTTLGRWMKDIPVGSTAVAMYRWRKGAKPVRNNGKLVPSKPEKYVGDDGKERVRWVEDTDPAPVIMPVSASSEGVWAPTLEGRMVQYKAAWQRLEEMAA